MDRRLFLQGASAAAIAATPLIAPVDAVTTSASYQPAGEMPYRGPGKPLVIADAEDATTIAMRAFMPCVRTGAQPIADARVGPGSALGVILANQARTPKREVPVPPLVLA